MNSDNQTKGITLDELRLSDYQYLELKHRQDVIVKWVAKIAEQNKIPIDLADLDWKP